MGGAAGTAQSGAERWGTVRVSRQTQRDGLSKHSMQVHERLTDAFERFLVQTSRQVGSSSDPAPPHRSAGGHSPTEYRVGAPRSVATHARTADVDNAPQHLRT